MKRIISMTIVLVLMFSICSCGKNIKNKTETENDKPKTVCNFYALSGPTGIAAAPLMYNSENGKTSINYNFRLAGENSEIIAKITNGEADIASVATNTAAVLYNKTGGNITFIALNTEGVLSLVTKDKTVNSFSDLKGKTVYSTGQGANPEYIINYCLEKNGLTPGKDVTLKFVSQPQELVTTAVTEADAILIAPQPVATAITVKDKNANIVADISDEWARFSSTKLYMGCIIARNDYISKNPGVIEKFLEEYKSAIESLKSDLKKSSEICEKYNIISPASVAEKAIPHCHIIFKDGKEMKTALTDYYNFLFNCNDKSIGGKLPDESFYYIRK